MDCEAIFRREMSANVGMDLKRIIRIHGADEAIFHNTRRAGLVNCYSRFIRLQHICNISHTGSGFY